MEFTIDICILLFHKKEITEMCTVVPFVLSLLPFPSNSRCQKPPASSTLNVSIYSRNHKNRKITKFIQLSRTTVPQFHHRYLDQPLNDLIFNRTYAEAICLNSLELATNLGEIDS